MNSENFSYEIGLFELKEYATARNWAETLKKERDEVIADLYEDCGPVITVPDYDLGCWHIQSTPVEDKAIEIIEKKEWYQKMIDRYERRAVLFDLALETLSPREQDVIRVAYFGAKNDLGLSQDYFQELLRKAEKKLCLYLSESQIKREQEWKQAIKETNKKRIQEWKRQRKKNYQREVG
jgi:hypothetical protein